MDPVNAWRPHAAESPGPARGSAEIRRKTSARTIRHVAAKDRGRIALIVETGIYDAISVSVSTYSTDLSEMGFSSILITVSGSAEYLRNTLVTLYNEPESLAGAVLIGELPYIIYEMNEDWGGGPAYTDFPCDLYFMDLNGVWEDALADPPVYPDNGKLDTWSGDKDLEIWVSRMNTGNLPSLGSEVDLLNNYFARNHALRWDVLNHLHVGLAYIDDDWEGGGGADTACLESVFGPGNVVTVTDPEATTGSDYISQRLTGDYHLDLIRSHGSPGGHGFYRDDKTSFDWIQASQYPLSDPAAVFFSLFVCSGCDYVWSDYLGGMVVFNSEGNTLLAWGSTKTGGMFDDYFMYERIAVGDCMGDGFKHWFNQVKDRPYAPEWWYGMVLVGDGSLCTHPMDCNRNGIPDESEIPVACGGLCTEDCDPDCNCNGIPDSCDKPDCNGDGSPDECYLPIGSGGLCTEDCDPDCNSNGILDECDPDCNNNTIPDDCDLSGGTSDDCNSNGVPDECDLVNGGSVLLYEDFEGGLPSGWTTTGNFQVTDQCGASHPDCGGSLWAYAGDAGTCSYGDNAWDELVAPLITLGFGLSELRFCSRIDSESWCDFGAVWINGTLVWQDSGYYGAWEEQIVDLRSLAPLSGSFATIAFGFYSDGGACGTLGWQVDNVRLVSGTPDCNSNKTLDECDIINGTSEDNNGNGVPDECECSISCDPPQLPEYVVAKNRYISFVPGNAGQQIGLRVTLTTLPADPPHYDFTSYQGTHVWVGPVTEICENSGQSSPPAEGCGVAWIGGPALTMQYANLQATRHCYDFGSVGLLHVTDCEIVPGGTYDVQAIHCDCDPSGEVNYSEPLTIHTSPWGNLCGPYDLPSNKWSEPDEGVDVTVDVTACLDKFKNVFGALIKPRSDVDPNVPDGKINVSTDVTCILDAFKNYPYPFTGPGTCP